MQARPYIGYKISFSQTDWKEISKQIEASNKLLNEYMQMDLRFLDDRIDKIFAIWNEMTLEHQLRSINLILTMLGKILTFPINQNCHNKVLMFNEVTKDIQLQLQEESKVKQDQVLFENSGLFSTLPIDLLSSILTRLNPEEFIKLTNTCCYLLAMKMKSLENPVILLNLISIIPIKNMLKFKEEYFRPTTNHLFQKLKNHALIEPLCYEAYLCYSLLTDNINELEAEYLNKLNTWLMQPHKKRYQQFCNSIKGIYSILEKDHQIFFKACCVNSSYGFENSLGYYCVKLENRYYFNFSGACFESNFFSHNKDIGWNYRWIDLRLANLENTKWPEMQVDYICLAGSNLKNAIMKNISSHRFNLESANCICIDLEGSKLDIHIGNANFEGASLKNLKIWSISFNESYKNVNLVGVDLSKCRFPRLDFSISDVELIDDSDLNSVDIFLSKMDSFHKMLQSSEKMIEIERYTYISRQDIAENISSFIKDSKIDYVFKPILLQSAINHPVFSRSDEALFKMKKYVGLFFNNYQPENTECQNILLSTLDILHTQNNIRSNKFI